MAECPRCHSKDYDIIEATMTGTECKHDVLRLPAECICVCHMAAHHGFVEGTNRNYGILCRTLKSVNA